VFSLPLNTREGFILSRVDGVSSVEDISMMVGVKLTELLAVLDRLADLGAVQLSWRAAKVSASPVSVSRAPVVAANATAESTKSDALALAHRVFCTPAAPSYDPAELKAPADIGIELKTLILNGFYGIEGKNYYQLLGLTRSADKKEIRGAYFELSRLFHPDSLFGKELGPFKAHMVAVFKRLTEAYEVLSRGARRKEYDEYLTSTSPSSSQEQALDKAAIAARAAAAAPVVEAPIGLPETVPRMSFPDAATRQRDTSMIMRPPLSAEDRRAQVRERLRRGLPGAPAGATSSPPKAADTPAVVPPAVVPRSGRPSTPAERTDSAIKGLRQSLRQTGPTAAGAGPVLAQLRKAKDAEQAGDLMAAASALQAALVLAPNQKDLQTQYARVSKLVARSLADNYEKQARYEEKQGQWAAAAVSWERVLEGRPEDMRAARCAVEALLRAATDLHKAQRLAHLVVDAAPSDAANVVLLARVLLAAGLKLNARRELEKAVKLDPQNEMIKNLLRETR
jgi:tetratricopeptide (TPR) repeat protein